LNKNNCKKHANKNNILGMDSHDEVEINSNIDEKNACISMQMEVKLSNVHLNEEKEITKLFHIKIHVNKTKVGNFVLL
jgi:hypothetical protein